MSDANDVVKALEKYEELADLSCLAIHPETPGYTTGGVLRDTRAAREAIASRRAVVRIKPMSLSDGRTDYFVSIKVGDREVTPHVFREEYKAAYHVALYDWLLNGTGEEPCPVDFGPEDWPAQKFDLSALIAQKAREPAMLKFTANIPQIVVPPADHDEISRMVLDQPWEIQKAIVTITAHCTAIRDQETGTVADLAACISQCCLDLAKALPDPAAFEAAPWPNGSNETVPKALRFLAEHERPIGGQQSFNSEHLYQLAAEIERMSALQLYRKRI